MLQGYSSIREMLRKSLRWFQRDRLKLDEDMKFPEKVQNKYTHRMAK